MATISSIIPEIHQPKNGLLPINIFDRNKLNDPNTLNKVPQKMEKIIYNTVNCLVRYFLKRDAVSAFEPCYLGASFIREEHKAQMIAKKVTGLDDTSIIACVHLASYEECLRSVSEYRYIDDREISAEIIKNIKVLFNRIMSFMSRYGSKIIYNHSLEGGYSDVIDTGVVPFVTSESLLMLSFNEVEPTPEETLEMLIYFVMGRHSIYPTLKEIKYVSFFNPITNTFYRCSAALISGTAMTLVEEKVLKYNENHYNVESNKKVDEFLSIKDAIEYLGIDEAKFDKIVKSKQLIIDKEENKVSVKNLNEYVQNKRMTNKLVWILSLTSILAIVILVVILLTVK